jgi:hypothetical protein
MKTDTVKVYIKQRGETLDNTSTSIVTSGLTKFGFKPVSFFGLLNNVLGMGDKFISDMFSIVYLLSIIGGLAGAIVFVVGAMSHHNRWKGNGAKMVGFSVLGFVAAIIIPGLILSIKSKLG